MIRVTSTCGKGDTRTVVYINEGGCAMKLRVITPITTHGFASAEGFLDIIRPDTELSHVELDYGPASIESDYDEMLATPDTVATGGSGAHHGQHHNGSLAYIGVHFDWKNRRMCSPRSEWSLTY